jgi:hypothetical protein
VAVHCSRHAYLIFTPIGIEVFPFFRPARGMQMIPWAQIDSLEIDDPPRTLTLHFNSRKSSGVHLSLAPIPVDRRALLVRMVKGRTEELEKSRAKTRNTGRTDSSESPVPSPDEPDSPATSSNPST